MRTLVLAAWASGTLLLARWGPLRSSFGARLPHCSGPWAMLVRLSTLYVIAASGWIKQATWSGARRTTPSEAAHKPGQLSG